MIQGRYRGDAGEIQGISSEDTREIQGKYKKDTVNVQGICVDDTRKKDDRCCI